MSTKAEPLDCSDNCNSLPRDTDDWTHSHDCPNRRRWDIIEGPDGVRVEQHFCRNWANGRGCDVPNAGHGLTTEEVFCKLLAASRDTETP